MQRLFRAICILSAGLPTLQAVAGETPKGTGPAATWAVETVGSSNILNDQSNLSDVGLHLRGEIGQAAETPIGALHVVTTLDLLKYRSYHFADQRFFGIDVGQASSAGSALSYRTHAGYAIGDSGDDLNLAGVLLGLRQTIGTFTAGGGVKLRLGDDMAAALSLEERYDDVGRARFVANLPDTKVNPDRNVVSGAFGIAKGSGGLQYGLVAELVHVSLFQQTPLQNAVPFDSYALRGRLIVEDFGGWSLTGELGIRQLRDGLGIYDRVRPVYALQVGRSFAARYELKGRLSCDFETEDTDDPLATYRHRFELEASVHLPHRVVLGAGAFAETGDNLLLENRERQWGLYGAVSYTPRPRLNLLLRVDYSRKHQTIIDVDQRTLAARLGVQASL